MSTIADQGVVGMILVRFHIFMEIDNELFFYDHSPHSNNSRRVGVSSKQKYVHKVLVKYYFKLAKEKVRSG